MYQYRAKLVKIIDGDTLDVIVDLGFYIKQEMRIRIAGIDAPEPIGKTKAKGIEAKELLREATETATSMGIQTKKIGKFGRYVADVWVTHGNTDPSHVFTAGLNLGTMMVERGLAERKGYD